MPLRIVPLTTAAYVARFERAKLTEVAAAQSTIGALIAAGGPFDTLMNNE